MREAVHLIAETSFPTSALALFESQGFGHYLRSHYGDRTFQHLYSWNWFDASLLIPYFIVMIVLAFYGMHRYQLVWLLLPQPQKKLSMRLRAHSLSCPTSPSSSLSTMSSM